MKEIWIKTAHPEGNNPGMSEKTWIKYHELLYKYNLKYYDQLHVKKEEKKIG